MMKRHFKSYRGFLWSYARRLLDLLMFLPIKACKWAIKRTVVHVNLATLKKLANLHPESTETISQEESVLLEKFAELIQPSRFVTRNGKIKYVAPTLEDITLWQMIEARRAETTQERIIGWCGNYAPSTITDMLKLSKYISTQMELADQLEEQLLPLQGVTHEENPIRIAKNILGVVQITAELFHCSFEEAKKVNYTDAVLAISKRHEEIERQKSKIK